MLGYKIYFNGNEFVADNIATEVQTVPCDSTVSWMANKTYAKCKECGEYFWQTEEERQWFIERELKVPCRCYSCRKNKL